MQWAFSVPGDQQVRGHCMLSMNFSWGRTHDIATSGSQVSVHLLGPLFLPPLFTIMSPKSWSSVRWLARHGDLVTTIFHSDCHNDFPPGEMSSLLVHHYLPQRFSTSPVIIVGALRFVRVAAPTTMAGADATADQRGGLGPWARRAATKYSMVDHG